MAKNIPIVKQDSPTKEGGNGGGGGGYRSRFTDNKTALSQFRKNIILAFYA